MNKIQDFLNQTDTGLKIQADSVSSYWLTGVQTKNFKITNQNNAKEALNIKEITVRMSVFPLFIGKINIESHIIRNEGEAVIFVSLSLFDLISNKFNVKEFEANFFNFKLDEFFRQFFYFFKNSNDPRFSLIAPLVADSSFGGFLNGNIDYDSAPQYVSKINLKIKGAFLDLNNATLDIPKQIFTAAIINLEFTDSTITVKKETLFSSQDMSISANGFIKNSKKQNNNQQINTPQTNNQELNMKVRIALSGQIEKNLGFLLPQLLKCPSSAMLGGKMEVNLMGSLDKLVCQQ